MTSYTDVIGERQGERASPHEQPSHGNAVSHGVNRETTARLFTLTPRRNGGEVISENILKI
jgi:hypothetical protein